MGDIQVGKELETWRRAVKSIGRLDTVGNLHRPRAAASIVELARIALGLAAFAGGPVWAWLRLVQGWDGPWPWGLSRVHVVAAAGAWTALGLLVTASLIRSLENLLHDASHGNVLPSRRGNRLLAQTLLAPILLDDLDAYRRAHLGHHFFLGSRRDPELLKVPRPQPGDTPWRSIRRVYLPTVLSWAFLRSSLAGRLPSLPAAARFRCLAWWTTMLSALGLLGGPAFALGCAGFWFGTRVTAYHLLKAFTEICDHALLDTDSILSFTRTMPARGILRAFLHPNNDNYHLAHHLFPGVPMCNLGRLHAILLELPEYAASRRYEAYFLGPGSVFASWGGPPAERWAVETAGAARGPVAAGKEAR